MRPLFVLFVSLLCLNSYGATSCSKNGTKVIYTNGVWTKKEDANKAKTALMKLGLDSQIDSTKVEYILKHNYTKTKAKDLFESAVQLFPEEYLNSIRKTKWEAFSLYITGQLKLPDLISESIQQNWTAVV